VIEIRHYLSRSGKDFLDHWMTRLAGARTGKDRNPGQPARRWKLWQLQVRLPGFV
jgi:hypothetical protein